MQSTQLLRVRDDGSPVYGYQLLPGRPAVSTVCLDDVALPPGQPAGMLHVHDFFVVVYFGQRGGIVQLGSQRLAVEPGDVYLSAPGQLTGFDPEPEPGRRPSGVRAAYFPAAAVTAAASPAQVTITATAGARSAAATGSPLLSWWAHPLLQPFAVAAAGGHARLVVPADDRQAWTARFDLLDRELSQRRHGHREAALALLRLLLIDVARLVREAGGGGPGTESLLREVFAFIDEHYHQPISLRDVARAVSLSPGHLTTVVGEKTGRTVQQWITERRLAVARALLDETDLAVQDVAREAGYRDVSFFGRSFRQAHGVAPSAWRRSSRHSRSAPPVHS
jgi:AraC-like DNA-binding protein